MTSYQKKTVNFETENSPSATQRYVSIQAMSNYGAVNLIYNTNSLKDDKNIHFYRRFNDKRKSTFDQMTSLSLFSQCSRGVLIVYNFSTAMLENIASNQTLLLETFAQMLQHKLFNDSADIIQIKIM